MFPQYFNMTLLGPLVLTPTYAYSHHVHRDVFSDYFMNINKSVTRVQNQHKYYNQSYKKPYFKNNLSNNKSLDRAGIKPNLISFGLNILEE